MCLANMKCSRRAINRAEVSRMLVLIGRYSPPAPGTSRTYDLEMSSREIPKQHPCSARTTQRTGGQWLHLCPPCDADAAGLTPPRYPRSYRSSDTNHAAFARTLLCSSAKIPEWHWENERSTIILPLMQTPEVRSDPHWLGAFGRQDHGPGARHRAFELCYLRQPFLPEGVR